jgi:hypothetical protein
MSEQIVDQDQPPVLVIAPVKKLFVKSLRAVALLDVRGSLVLFGLAQVLIGLPIVAVIWYLLRSSARLEQESRDRTSVEEARADRRP